MYIIHTAFQCFRINSTLSYRREMQYALMKHLDQ